jgi:predicted  nucleic acid-binding Zn-ribbon protein
MKFDIEKYLKNKDITISNDDLDISAMEKDFTKGYTKNSEIKQPDYSNYVEKTKYDELQTNYTSLETNYNNTVKTLSETNDKMTRLNLENKLVKKGFKEENFDEIVKLRSSLYADEKDDDKAINSIAEKFKNTYFPQAEPKNNIPFTQAPDEGGTKGNGTNTNPIKIGRSTSIKDLMIPVAK